MSQTKRRHHIVPIFVLRNFTQVVKKAPHVWVFDRARQKVRHAAPKEVGYRRDYFMIHSESAAPDLIEDFFGRIEGVASTSYQQVVETRVLPARDTEAFGNLMHLVALLHARAPHHRSMIQEFQQDVIRLQLRMVIRDQASWDRFLRTELGAKSPFRTRQEVAAFLESGKPLLDRQRLDHEHTITTAQIFHELVPRLRERQWSLAVAPEAGPYFVTSEVPTSLVWNEPYGEDIWKFGPPGLDGAGTQLLFPMSKTMVLVGVDSGDSEHVGVRELDPEEVAAMNTRILLYAFDEAFGARSEFVWLDPQTQTIANHWEWMSMQRPKQVSSWEYPAP